LKGFGDYILINLDPNLPVKEKTFDKDPVKAAKETKTAFRNYKLAVASFTITFTTVALMNRVNESKTEDFPSGLAYKIVQGLIKRYQPSDSVLVVCLLNVVLLITVPAQVLEELDALTTCVCNCRSRNDDKSICRMFLLYQQ
jgi:hypothetical protein